MEGTSIDEISGVLVLAQDSSVNAFSHRNTNDLAFIAMLSFSPLQACLMILFPIGPLLHIRALKKPRDRARL